MAYISAAIANHPDIVCAEQCELNTPTHPENNKLPRGYLGCGRRLGTGDCYLPRIQPTVEQS